MTQRRDFIDDYRRELYSMTELCAQYGVSRRVGYKWIDRYKTLGYDGLVDARRTPSNCPHRTPEALVELVLAARRAHPTWGPRKLIPYLARRHPGWTWPAASTVGAILQRHGLVGKRRRRPRPVRTITADNGTEFHGYRTLEQQRPVRFFFATPHHSWERGSNENLNGLLRQYLPKGVSMAGLTQHECNRLARQLNRRPRKRLNYQTPEECYA